MRPDLPLIKYLPSIPGLEVIEPETVLSKALAALEYERACKVEADHGARDMDECAAWAVGHPEVVR